MPTVKKTDAAERRVISILVDNQSGVLARVSSLFCRRGFNIDSLTVSTTNDPNISRITVTTHGDENSITQLLLQTDRLEVTRQIFELDQDNSLQRELLLLKVACDVHMVFELTGKPSKIDAFLVMFQDYNILEMCRTGVTAIERGGMHQHMQKPVQEVSGINYPTYGPKGNR